MNGVKISEPKNALVILKYKCVNYIFVVFFELNFSKLISGQRKEKERKEEKNPPRTKDFCQLINTLILNLK